MIVHPVTFAGAPPSAWAFALRIWIAIVIAGGFAVIPIWIYFTGGRS